MVARNSLINKIKAEFKQEYSIAVSPDFPHLISVPDILIGGRGRLCAIFIAKTYEINHPDLLLSRLVLSRLGLPDNLISVLVLPINNSFINGYDTVSRNFDLLITNDEVKSVKYLIESDYKSRNLNSTTRFQTVTRYSIFSYENSKKIEKLSYSNPQTLFYELRIKGGYQNAKTQNWNLHDNLKQDISFDGLAVRENVTVLASSFENYTSPIAKLRRFCYRSVQFDYFLDSGVPYINSPKANLLLLDKIPYFKFDPQKSLRSSAFSGLVLVHAENLNDIEFIFDKLDKAMETML
jgi:hypothetical protein